MSLVDYHKKRHFSKTPEPSGQLKKTGSPKLRFVVQKHSASHLHYDFRLQIAGVLKSWAVPKGPSLNPDDKRLAMMVEDHPFEYRKFEGVIPEGNYGAGKVIIWDEGWYEPRSPTKNAEAALLKELKAGHLTFLLYGKKLKGEFALIKNEHMQKNAWLLVKKNDRYASQTDITKSSQSVVSGKQVEEIGPSDAKYLKLDNYPKSDMPRAVKPMLATLTSEAFDNDDWLYEIKWDGYRAIASWDGQKAELYSRNGNNFSGKYPLVCNSLKDLGHQVVLDGEVVTLDKEGRSRFEWLQNWGRQPKGQLVYYVFDLLWCDGHDLRDQPLAQRKSILQKLLQDNQLIRYSDHIVGQGREFFKSAAAQSLEGIMAKDSQSYYRENIRSKQWLKIKTHLRQEAVIGGFTEPRGSRKHIGALVLGIYKKDQLIYAGHTGGGIPPSQMKDLRSQLDKLEVDSSPFANKFKPNAPVHWTKPELICEVSFSEWTADNHMRQPIFVGLRSDKNPKQIAKEQAREVKSLPKKATSNSRRPKLEFTHQAKIFFPEAGYTKGDLINYYNNVSKVMLPYLINRPHNLLRQPNGLNGQAFFQKDIEKHPDWIKTVAIYSKSNQKDIHYMVCDSLDSLLYMVQLGSIEVNPWNSTLKHLDNPDWIVMDLDPEDIGFDKVVEVALAARQVLEKLGIESYPKTSGKTGIHIYIPLAARYDYTQARQFGEILAHLIHDQVPDITSLERSPKKRQKKIYIDYLQNREGQTLAAPYSVRPTKEASVSTPLKWTEVNAKLNPASFTIKTILKRLDKQGDLWQPVLGRGANINQVLKTLGS